jgi:uncharacterized membrane protein (DUF4010 family)
MTAQPLAQLAISLLLGLLIGLQRQRTEASIGGIRTYPLIAAFGTISGWLAQAHGAWIIAAGLVSLAALLVVSNLLLARDEDHDSGQTSEVAALLLYAIGAYLVMGDAAVAVVLGGVIAVLLHYRDPLHAFAARIGERDVTAIMQFVLISLVILPVLPNRTFGPYETLNPFQTWLMVVLIVGISLAGYVAYKLLGSRQGAMLAGIVGGLVSSTATTASFARRAKSAPGSAGLAGLVITIASGIVYARVLVEIAIVAPTQARAMMPPIAAMLGWCALIALGLWVKVRGQRADLAEHGNPASLRVAIVFAALYALVSFAVAAAQAEFGGGALYPVAVLSGLTDMDAITLSSSQLVTEGRLGADTAWRMLLVASFANLVFKCGIVGALGGRALLARVAPAFGLAIAGGALLLWLWPVAA